MTWNARYNGRDRNEANIVLLGGITHEHEWVGTFDRYLRGIGLETIIYGACAKLLANGDTSYSVYVLSSGHIEKIGTVRKSELTQPER